MGHFTMDRFVGMKTTLQNGQQVYGVYDSKAKTIHVIRKVTAFTQFGTIHADTGFGLTAGVDTWTQKAQRVAKGLNKKPAKADKLDWIAFEPNAGVSL